MAEPRQHTPLQVLFMCMLKATGLESVNIFSDIAKSRIGAMAVAGR